MLYCGAELVMSDKPERILKSDRIEYKLNGKLHREDGPAIEYASGTKCWYLNGLNHRENGPAVEYPNGTKYWLINGLFHRDDGPAVYEIRDDLYLWFYKGKLLNCKTQEEFLRLMKLKVLW